MEIVPPSFLGMALMVLGAALATAMHASVRHLSADLHPIQIAFLRQFFGLIFLAPWFVRIGFGALKTRRGVLHAIRGAVLCGSNIAWFWAISLIPLAKVAAIGFSQVLFSVLGAVIFLGEKSSLRRWSALVLGFAGVAVIVRPGYEVLTLGIILAIGSRFLVAAHKVMAKSLTATESSATIVVYGSLAVAIGTFIPALLVWRPVTSDLFLWVVAMAVLGALGQVAMVQAYKLADIGAVEPLAFTRLIWAALFGFILFAEIPSVWTWLGAGLILLAATFMARGEAKADARKVRESQKAAEASATAAD